MMELVKLSETWTDDNGLLAVKMQGGGYHVYVDISCLEGNHPLINKLRNMEVDAKLSILNQKGS